jgi:uncharacterized membrane protein YfcA
LLGAFTLEYVKTGDPKAPLGALISVGVVGGLLAGLFGVGGGIIMVPLLLWWAQLDQRRAQATSLLAIAPAALIGTASYATGEIFPLIPGLLIAVGAIGGAQLGAFLLRKLSLTWLRWTFAFFVMAMAITVGFTVPNRSAHLGLDLLTGAVLVLIGVVMGTSAGLFGIGGGIIAIPLLMLIFGIGDLEAKGISLIAMAPAALSGSYSHVKSGSARLRDGVWVALGAFVATPLGALGAFKLPEASANVIFGGFALVISVVLIVRAARMKPQD